MTAEDKKPWAYGEASSKLYLLVNRIVLEAEAGKPLSEALLNEAHKVMAEADELPRFNRLLLGKKVG